MDKQIKLPQSKTEKHCKEINRCLLENPELPMAFIKDILVSKNQDRILAKPFNFEGNIK